MQENDPQEGLPFWACLVLSVLSGITGVRTPSPPRSEPSPSPSPAKRLAPPASPASLRARLS